MKIGNLVQHSSSDWVTWVGFFFEFHMRIQKIHTYICSYKHWRLLIRLSPLSTLMAKAYCPQPTCSLLTLRLVRRFSNQKKMGEAPHRLSLPEKERKQREREREREQIPSLSLSFLLLPSVLDLHSNRKTMQKKKSSLQQGLDPWNSGDWWVFNPLSHGDYFIKDFLSFALVQEWPRRRNSPMFFFSFWWRKWHTRWQDAFAINRRIAITGFTMNSSVHIKYKCCHLIGQKSWLDLEGKYLLEYSFDSSFPISKMPTMRQGPKPGEGGGGRYGWRALRLWYICNVSKPSHLWYIKLHMFYCAGLLPCRQMLLSWSVMIWMCFHVCWGRFKTLLLCQGASATLSRALLL